MIFSRFAFTFLLALLPASAELLQARRLSNKEVLAVKADSVSEHLGHYGKPPTGCTDDELVLQIQGVPGIICAPKCADFMPCPSDLPDGVTASPQCALQDQSGHKYCILICNPATASLNFLRGGDSQCGEEATCQPVQGTGVCTYPM
mmetsp:Transcript_5447/g.11150  ORF Transcript_5447/g.11150 Transcript_5447/m.11150 type:complete len:147 (-) Transcript_5447:182-622(-)|eukprot:CAMPEP_0168727092 /NCGR_PEP_ID=MMETSP0724-20121128/5002_1 /TAXON_ID=265536 /ORGANISM="Amphiprora sp., Strain CCMP467" /LENGTH=146 /DNA_ID=CAMNT_0008773919 /DNA_START=52 /DNA_END=492 /DNA_ORIENTATION=+